MIWLFNSIMTEMSDHLRTVDTLEFCASSHCYGFRAISQMCPVTTSIAFSPLNKLEYRALSHCIRGKIFANTALFFLSNFYV